jgi:Ran GTPase-activating protein (RanGAP) involved in mRNA processing and transport
MLNHLPLTIWKHFTFSSQDFKNIAGVSTYTYQVIQDLRQSKDFPFTLRIIKIPMEWICCKMIISLITSLDIFVQKWNLAKVRSVKHIVYFSSAEGAEVYQICSFIPKEFYVSIHFTAKINGLLMNVLENLGSRLISLDLEINQVTHKSVKKCLLYTPFLENLNLSNKSFKQIDLEDIAPALERMNRLTDLNLSGNIITSLAPSLKYMTSLLKLDISRTQNLHLIVLPTNVINTNFQVLAPSLKYMTRLTNLNLSGNIITVNAAKALAPALTYMTNLLSLDISQTNIGHMSLRVLTTSIVTMTNLEYLNIGCTWTGSDGQDDLVLILQRLTRLKELDMSFSEIGVDKMIAFSPFLTKLKRLNLSGNQIAEYFECPIVSFKMPNLEFLNLAANNITPKTAVGLAKSLERMSSLTHLVLRHNKIGTDGMNILSSSIKNMKNLKTLDIRDNMCSDFTFLTSLQSLTLINTH